MIFVSFLNALRFIGVLVSVTMQERTKENIPRMKYETRANKAPVLSDWSGVTIIEVKQFIRIPATIKSYSLPSSPHAVRSFQLTREEHLRSLIHIISFIFRTFISSRGFFRVKVVTDVR